MKILQVHNFYQRPGGEDQVCAAEYELLTRHGHEVIPYHKHNEDIARMSSISVGLRTVWNRDTYREIRNLIRREGPEIVHAHNTFPLVSPAMYYAAAAERVPVIQTLHNYRLLCPAATLFRDGRVCEECMRSTVPYQSVLHGCYRNSRAATAAVASMLVGHRIARTWNTRVNTYIALTEFSKSKFIEGGLPEERIVVKPNCLTSDPGEGQGTGGYAFFAGRLTDEKGVRVILNAWERLGSVIPLKIAGAGPLAEWVKERTAVLRCVEWLGHCERDQLMTLYQHAAFTIFPSQYYEGLPMTLIESFACGTPVIASGLGSMNEIVVDGINGFRFTPGDESDLIERVKAVLARPDQLRAMRRSSRAFYEQNYTPERNYDALMRIYERAMHNGEPA